MLKALRVIFILEMTLLLRRKEEWLYPLSFFIILMSLFPLTLAVEHHVLQKILPGCFWMAALFSSLLSIQTIFLTDTEEGHLEQLLLSDYPLTLTISAKLCAHWLISELPLILLTPIFAYLFDLPTQAIFVLFSSLLLGTIVITLLGSFIVALTLGLRQQGVLLGLMIFPLITPVLIFGVNIVEQALAGFSVLAPFALLAGITVMSMTCLPFTIATTLRMSASE